MKEPVFSQHARSQSSVPLLPFTDHTPPPTPTVPVRPKPRQSLLELLACRRRFFVLTCASLSFASLLALSLFTLAKSSSHYVVSDLDPSSVATSVPFNHSANATSRITQIEEVLPPPVPHSPYLLGPPTDSFRDNLRNDTKYITSWISAGWSTPFDTPFAKIEADPSLMTR